MPGKRALKSTDVAACTCASLRRASRAITQLYDGALQAAGVTSTQFTLMSTLSQLGETPVSQLAGALGMDRTSLTRTLRPLQNAKLVRVVPGPDGRVRPLVVTPAGERKLAEALPLWESVQRRVVRRMGTAHWSDLLDHLSTATEAASP